MSDVAGDEACRDLAELETKLGRRLSHALPPDEGDCVIGGCHVPAWCRLRSWCDKEAAKPQRVTAS